MSLNFDLSILADLVNTYLPVFLEALLFLAAFGFGIRIAALILGKIKELLS